MNQRKFFLLSILWVLLTQVGYAQDEVLIALQTRKSKVQKIYSIGTGISVNYLDENVGVMVDSFHFLNSRKNINDRALLKLGMGLNYNLGTTIPQEQIGFMFNFSIGYMYMLYDLKQRILDDFGAGFSLDYNYISLENHSVGASIYIGLNYYLLGLGAGIILNGTRAMDPYLRFNIAIVF